LKNLYFNRKDGILRNLEEKPKPKKKVNWDKIIYFIVLFLIIFFVFKFFFVRAVYVVAPGHVLFKSLKIRVPEDITIQRFFKFEGDSIAVGDTIFSYISYSDEEDALDFALNGESSQPKSDQWAEKEIYQLNKTIALNKIEMDEKSNLITYYKGQIIALKNEVILEITPKSKIELYEKEIEKLTLEISSINKENQIYLNLINQLKMLVPTLSQSSFSGNGMGMGDGNEGLKKYYISPIKGTITRLYKSDFEVALKSEDILNMHEKEDIYIKAFFDQEDIAYFKEGDEVTVIFPDGEESIGHIKRFYFATYILPDEFQKKYESTTRAIAVDIFPIENESEIKWKAFYKMNVTVRINRWK
jgi:hypothetical protein